MVGGDGVRGGTLHPLCPLIHRLQHPAPTAILLHNLPTLFPPFLPPKIHRVTHTELPIFQNQFLMPINWNLRFEASDRGLDHEDAAVMAEGNGIGWFGGGLARGACMDYILRLIPILQQFCSRNILLACEVGGRIRRIGVVRLLNQFPGINFQLFHRMK